MAISYIKEHFIAPIFLLALLLCYPLVWFGARHFSEFQFFTPAILALLAVFLLTLDTERLNQFFRADVPLTHRMLYALIPGGLALLLHYYHLRGNHMVLLSGLYYFSVPLLGALYYREFATKILWLVAGLGVISFVLMLSLRLNGEVPIGLTGNWNWSSTLLLCGMLSLSILWRRNWAVAICSITATLLILWWMFGQYYSRGTILAVILAGAVVSCMLVRKYRKWLIASISIASLASIITLGIHLEQADQVRMELFKAAIRLIEEKPLMGHGPGRFEDAVSPHLSESYYLLPISADRNPHPHNELLFLGSTLGIGGMILLLAYAAAALAALNKLRKSAEPTATPLAVIALLFFLLFFHGQLDVILNNWPCNTIFLLFSGILWGYAADNGAKAPPLAELEQSNVVWPLRVVQSLLLFGVIFLLIQTGFSSFYAREARLQSEHGDKKATHALWEKSISFQATPQNLYAAALTALFDRKDPAEALRLLNRILPETSFTHYLHSNQMTGRALAAQGKYKEALPFFDAEQRNYPLSIVNLTLKRQVEEQLGEKDAAKATSRQLFQILEKRSLRPEAIPYLQKNWARDFQPETIPAEFTY